MWNGRNEPPPALDITPGTLQFEVSERERHNTRRNAGRVPAKHLGPFRRELLLHLAVREAVIRADLRPGTVPASGLPWEPKQALARGVELTRTLSVKISNALAALEDLGYIRRLRTQGDKGPTRSIKVTRHGAREAMEIVYRRGKSKREARAEESFFAHQVRQNPLEYATWVAEQAEHWLAKLTDLGLEPAIEDLFQNNPAYRRGLMIVRAYVRENPGDQRTAEALRKAEKYMPEYRPTQKATDALLYSVALAATGVHRSLGEEDPDYEWLAQAKTFDLTGGWKPTRRL